MRLFVAIQPPQHALAALARAIGSAGHSSPESTQLPAAGHPRWIDQLRWHITLGFLGDVPEHRLQGLEEALARAARESPSLSLRFAGAGTFPSRGRPKVLWIGITGDDMKLRELARSLRHAVRRAGITLEDRDWAPHMTVGRWRKAETASPVIIQRLEQYRGPAFRVTEVVLFSSYLGPHPRHEPIRAWPLAEDYLA